MTARRIEVRVAALRAGSGMQQTARELGATYNRLILVLDGARKRSERPEAGIRTILNA